MTICGIFIIFKETSKSQIRTLIKKKLNTLLERHVRDDKRQLVAD